MLRTDWWNETAVAFGGWPKNYLLIDIETTGFGNNDPHTVPTQIGWADVENGEIVNTDAVFLDWTTPEIGLDVAELTKKIEKTAASMAEKGLKHTGSIAEMCTLGLHPWGQLSQYHSMLNHAAKKRVYIVGHSICVFDLPLLNAVALRYPQQIAKLTIAWDDCIDLGLLELARVQGMKPIRDVTKLGDYYQEAKAAGRKHRYGLTTHCVPEYGLNINSGNAHEAVADCYTTYCFFEAVRPRSVQQEIPCL